MGSRYLRRSDGRWVAAISVGPRGNQQRIVRYASTRKEADAELDELRKLVPTPGGSRTTVGAYLRSWLDVAGRRSLKASTWRTYDVALRHHIDPAIGHIALGRLTADRWPKLAGKAGVNVTMHQLRHAQASLLVTMGVHPRVIAARLGHTTIAQTMDRYAHVAEASDVDAARLLDEAFG